MTASLFTRYANGLQAWPNDALAQVPFGATVDERTIGIPAHGCRVETYIHPQTKDAGIYVEGLRLEDDIRLYIPRGGSVVIEAVDDPVDNPRTERALRKALEGESDMERARR